MKYLINQNTKQHVVYSEGIEENCPPTEWMIAIADDDGWLKHNTGECPVPKDSCCDVRYPDKSVWFNIKAKNAVWEFIDGISATEYRPVFNKKSELQDPKESPKYPHYYKDVSNLEFIDVYRVLKLFEVVDPAIAHAIKKLLVAGGRGNKDRRKDYAEAIDSIKRATDMLNEEEQ